MLLTLLLLLLLRTPSFGTQTCLSFSDPTGASQSSRFLRFEQVIYPYRRVFVDQKEVGGNRGGDAYASFGIDPAGVVVVIVRPDGYVGTMAPFDQVRDIDRYFAAFTKISRVANTFYYG
jgi:hypothetical protein